MVRKALFPFLVGGFAFLLTFIISIGNNTVVTSLSRSVFGFLLFFVLMFPVCWFFMRPLRTASVEEKVTGTKINIQTPEEDLVQEMALNAEYGEQDKVSGGFTPLSPPVLKKKQGTEEPMSSEDIANAIRVLSG